MASYLGQNDYELKYRYEYIIIININLINWTQKTKLSMKNKDNLS